MLAISSKRSTANAETMRLHLYVGSATSLGSVTDELVGRIVSGDADALGMTAPGTIPTYRSFSD
jgi:hypothetical protein